MEDEIWSDVEGYENAYAVSSLGRVKSKDRYIIQKRGNFHHRKEKILKPVVNKNNGYLQVMFVVHTKCKLVYLHRIVAKAFVDNPNGYPNVTHIDGDNNNNRADNLMWVTKSNRMNKKLNLF